MAVFPDSPVPSYEQVVSQRFKTIISVFDGGNEQRRAKWTFPKYDVRLSFNAITSTDMDNLWDFFKARSGAYESFYYFLGRADQHPYNVTGELVTVADGASTTYNLPVANSQNLSVYVNSSKLSTSDYTVSSTSGVNGEDVINFSFTPSSGDVITCDFTGYHRIRCRFEGDTMDRSLFEKDIFRAGVTLKGLPQV